MNTYRYKKNQKLQSIPPSKLLRKSPDETPRASLALDLALKAIPKILQIVR